MLAAQPSAVVMQALPSKPQRPSYPQVAAQPAAVSTHLPAPSPHKPAPPQASVVAEQLGVVAHSARKTAVDVCTQYGFELGQARGAPQVASQWSATHEEM